MPTKCHPWFKLSAIPELPKALEFVGKQLLERSTRKVHLSLEFASQLYPWSSALHISLEIRHQPSHLK
jgi:hypothetical protein